MLKGFRKHNGTRIIDVPRYIRDWQLRHPQSEIHVGSDSKQWGNAVKYSVVICLRELGRGVHEIYKTERLHTYDKMERLWHEVDMAVEVATRLRELGPITVHVDLNSDSHHRSNRIYDASIGYIKGLGFDALGKPHAWAATSGANRHTH